MKKIIYLIAALMMLTPMVSFSQSSGSISGYVFNANDSLSIPGAYVIIKTQQKKYWATTDLNGYFKIKPIEPGSYSLLISYSGLDSMIIKNITVTGDRDTYLNKRFLTSKSLPPVEIVWKPELIDRGGGNVIKLGPKVTGTLPSRGDMVAALSYISSDYFVSDQTKQVHFRGSRAGTSAYYVDGIRSETMVLPGLGVGTMQIYSGGIPARFGDFTGGVIEVESKSYNDAKEEREARNIYVQLTEAPKTITVEKTQETDTETEKLSHP